MADRASSGSVLQTRAPLVGRAAEMALLEQSLEVVRGGEPRIVSIVGETGTGKTRLVQDFVLAQRDRLAPSGKGRQRPVRVFRGSARDLGTSYGLFARLLRARFGLVEGMDPEKAKAQVRAQVAKVLEDRKVGDVIYFLGHLLDLPFPESPLTKAVQEDAQQAELLRRAVFKSFLEADAQTGPMVLVFDDLQLAHGDSIALLRYLLEYLAAPLLVVCVGRTELLSRYEDWDRVGEDRHQLVELGVLSDDDAAAMMQALLAPCVGDEEALVDAALAFAAGNPSLLEQMVRIFHDVGVLREVQGDGEHPRWQVELERLASAKLPMTIDDAVSARIAALEPGERRLLEHASVMGSVFWRAGFTAMQRADEDAPELWDPELDDDTASIDELLGELVERDYILQLPDSTFVGTDEYIFKHNKEREAITHRVPAAVARRGHKALADWMEHQSGVDTNEEYLAMLGSHREAGGEAFPAGLTYLQAGHLARTRYANARASEYFERGLSLLEDGAVAERLMALHDYGDVLQRMGRVDDALAAFQEMLNLAYRLDLWGRGGAAHNRIGRLYREIGSLDEAMPHFETALTLFRRAEDERGVASTIDDMGQLHWLKGEYDLALEELREGLNRRQSLGNQRSIALSLNNLGLVLQDSGDFSSALDAFDEALRIRREIGDLVGVAVTLAHLGVAARDLNDYPRALELLQEAQQTAKEIGDRNRLAVILTQIGSTLYASGQPQKAIQILRQGEGLCDELGDNLGLAEALRALGKAYMLQGDMARARDCIGRAVDLFASVRSKVHLGSALRTLGEITAAGGWGAAHTKSAREYYARSVAIFEQTGNEVELARTFRVYAHFLRAEPEYVDDPVAIEEAEQMHRRAEEIFGRLRVSAADRTGPNASVPR